MSEIIHPLVRLADPTPEGWHESPSYESEERNDKRIPPNTAPETNSSRSAAAVARARRKPHSQFRWPWYS